MNTLTISIEEQIKEIGELIRGGMVAWVKAGEILAAMVDEDPLIYDKLTELLPEYNTKFLKKFEQIGRKQLYPQLMWEQSLSLRRLMNFQYSDQVKYYTEPVEVLILKDDGEQDSLLVLVRDLTQDQVKQVFSTTGIRDLAAQRAWIVSRAQIATRVRVHSDQPYSIRNRKLVVHASETDREFSVTQVAALLQQMTI